MPIPAYAAAGKWTLLSPFKESTAWDNTLFYQCESIEGFDALLQEGVDILTDFYVPYGLTVTEYDRDYIANECIVTLLAADGTSFKVPTSYIDTFPNAKSVPYTHGFLTLDLSLLPDGLDMSDLQTGIKETVDAYLGISSGIKLTTMPISTSISYTQHAQLEQARRANITYTGNPAIQLKLAEETIQGQAEKIDALQQAVLVLQEKLDSI